MLRVCGQKAVYSLGEAQKLRERASTVAKERNDGLSGELEVPNRRARFERNGMNIGG
jgi:hypothetical protein